MRTSLRGIDTVVWLLPTALAACLLCSLLVVNARQRTTLIDYNVPLQLQALQGVGELQGPDSGVPVVEIGGRLFVVVGPEQSNVLLDGKPCMSSCREVYSKCTHGYKEDASWTQSVDHGVPIKDLHKICSDSYSRCQAQC
mmetsp:Transcript_93790/g.136971  ORF Transcript_93790/g.136971 Transcript_93790/m.136971 type:complete len:140 (+) Transcript_93790:2-421(+)